MRLVNADQWRPKKVHLRMFSTVDCAVAAPLQITPDLNAGTFVAIIPVQPDTCFLLAPD